MLKLEDSWVWDSWVADDGELYHLFFLQAPRSLGDMLLRHVNARVGHATSRDLVTWEYHGVCFEPADEGFDSLAIWTGSVLRAEGRWWMFYSALSRAGHGWRDQRIGVAVSDDLFTWERTGPRPLVEVDPTWYATLDRTPPGTTGPDLMTASETWRDPLVLPDPGGDGWHMFVTARGSGADQKDDGVVGHATSRDLLTWQVQPPRSAPGAGFGHLEVLQNKVVDGRPVLVFTCRHDDMTPERVARSGVYCTWSVPGESVLGPWDVSAARPFTADPDLFAAPLVQRRDGSWVIMGFRNLELRGEDGLFVHDPIPVTLDADGYLVAAD